MSLTGQLGLTHNRLIAEGIAWTRAKMLRGSKLIINNGIITWSDRQSGIAHHVKYEDEFRALAGSGQYSFLCSDGAFLQFYYAGNADTGAVSSARLAYYPIPTRARCSLRVDLDTTHSHPYFHSTAHLQAGSLPGLRLSVSHLPLPEKFFELVARFYYPACWYRRYGVKPNLAASSKNGDDPCWRPFIDQMVASNAEPYLGRLISLGEESASYLRM